MSGIENTSKSREERIAELEQQLENLKRELEELKSGDSSEGGERKPSEGGEERPSEGGERNPSEGGDENPETVPTSVEELDIGDLYGWNRGRPITKQEVIDVVNNLKEPYHTEISNFIKNQDILGLQKYLNQKIREGKIDATELEKSLNDKGIRFDGSIIEDGKFGPQTLETIRFILDETPIEEDKKDKEPEQVEPTEEEKNNITNINITINQYFTFVDGRRILNPEHPLPDGKLIIGGIEYPEWHEGQTGYGFRIIENRIVIGIFDESGHTNGNTIIIDKSGTIMVGIIENGKKTGRWIMIDKDGKITVIIIDNSSNGTDPVDPGDGIDDGPINPEPPKKGTNPVDPGNGTDDPILPIGPISPEPPKKGTDPVDPGDGTDKPDNPVSPIKPGEPVENPPKDPEDKEVLTPHWIEDEMRDILDNLRSGATKGGDWSSRRNYASGKETCKEDDKNKKAILTTYGSSFEGGSIENNTCELDWETGNIQVCCGKNKYLMPVRSQPLDLDEKGYPKHTPENINKVRAFTEVGNLMNFLKANYILNGGPYSFEESGGDIEYNNGTFDDTEIVSNETFNTLSTKYRSTGIVFNIGDRRHMACLLNGIKLDTENLTLDELGDGCTDEDVALSKRYSKKYT